MSRERRMMCGACQEKTAHLYTGDTYRRLRCVVIGQKSIIDALEGGD